MSIQSAKEDFKNNLKENRLLITKEDENVADLLIKKVKSIKKNLNDLNDHNRYMESPLFFEDRHYTQFNLFVWAIIVVASLYAFHFFCLTDEGQPLEVIKVLTEPGYTQMLAPFLVQGVLLFLSAFLGYMPAAQFILTVICLFAYSVFEIELFGSYINVYYFSIIGGTVITVIARIIEYFVRIRKKLKRPKKGKVYLEQAEKQLDEAENIYLNAPTKAPVVSDFWYSHSYTLSEQDRKDYIHCGNELKIGTWQDSYDSTRRSSDTVTTLSRRVFNQVLEIRPLNASSAEVIINKYKLYPLFGLGIKEFSPEYKYQCLYHKWLEEGYESSDRQYTDYMAIENKEKTELKSDLESLEDKYLGHSADWYEETHPHASTAQVYAVDDYRQKKKALLDEIPDNYYVEQEKHDISKNSYRYNYEFFAYIKITSPDGELLGIYVMEAGSAIDLALKVLKEETNLSPSALSVPYSPAQRSHIDGKFFSR